eukprot:2098592-Amphidinium_carterae.1
MKSLQAFCGPPGEHSTGSSIQAISLRWGLHGLSNEQGGPIWNAMDQLLGKTSNTVNFLPA